MALEIAKTIREQLYMGGRIKVMSWGAHNWQGGEDFLIFKVQGHHFTGNVKISLHPTDTYIVEFFKPRSTEPVKVFEMIYCDQLTEVIDGYVEYIPSYENR